MKLFKGLYLILIATVVTIAACAPVDVPEATSVKIDPINPPLDRYEGLNERRNPITRVRLGRDMLVPKIVDEDQFPADKVGPYELRAETLATALQLILADYDISIAFESDAAFDTKITVANLKGDLNAVVDRVCGLANLYCHFEKGNLTVKETETFVVDLPPIGNISAEGSNDTDAYGQISSGLGAIIGEDPTIDESTRLLIYTATHRTQKYARKYFERLRKNTALVVFETNIWEVTLDNDNRTGIQWNALFNKLGSANWTTAIATVGGVSADNNPITITPTYTGSGDFSTDAVFEFISSRGAVKTISQPQITMLSGSQATMEVLQEENFISGVSRTTDDSGDDTVSTTTETIETGLKLVIKSAWDQATVYGGLNISLDDLLKIDEFEPDSDTTIQLPQTTTRSLQTEIRVRPGDAILIGGLVSERESFQDSGPGFMEPLFSTSRTTIKETSELVFLLRPRVVVFEEGDEYLDSPQVVNAPRSGTGNKSLGLVNLSEKVQDLFTEKDSPVTKFTSRIGDMFGLNEEDNIRIEDKKETSLKADEMQEDVKSAPVEDVKVEKILEDYNSYKKTGPNSDVPVEEKYGEPVSSPRDLLRIRADVGDVEK